MISQIPLMNTTPVFEKQICKRGDLDGLFKLTGQVQGCYVKGCKVYVINLKMDFQKIKLRHLPPRDVKA
jgi:hypothetical protein